MRFLRSFLLSLIVFGIAQATHEVLHLVVFWALGYPASLLVTPWHLALVNFQIYGLHAAPANPDGVPLEVLVANNAGAPLAAGVLLLVLALAGRGFALRTALLANILALVFFAAIETGYPLLEEVRHVNADVLLWPEVNYGGVLLIFMAVCFVAGGQPKNQPTVTTSTTGGPRRAPLQSHNPVPLRGGTTQGRFTTRS